METDIIILTMSSKYKGYCVAGIDTHTGKWVRLVSDKIDADGALSDKNIIDGRGEFCKPLDIVHVRILRKTPTAIQPENILIDGGYRWQMVSRLSPKDLENYLIKDYDFLFCNNSYSISCEEAQRLNYSILMVKVDNLATYVNDFNKTKAKFFYKGNLYDNISVTDPEYYMDNNSLRAKRAVIVMSLANKPFNGQYYKFVAKIFVCD